MTESNKLEGSPVLAAEDEESRGVPGWALAAGVLGVTGALVATLMLTMDDNDVAYSKLVDQVVDDPTSFKDRELRVEGELREGSITFRRKPCEWRFVLEKNGKEMPVQFPQCVVPDTFRDGQGISVTVQGKIDPRGTFHAVHVVPRCPSKYEMQERLKAGEKMPHAPKSPLSTVGPT